MARIEPVPSDEWPDGMRDALAAMIPPVRRHPEPVRENRPKGRTVLGAFANHTDLARAFFTFNGHILWGTTLTARWREMIVLRVATRRRSASLWAEHVFVARDAGMTDEEIARVAFGPDAPLFEPLDVALLRSVDEVIDDGAITEPTWLVLAAELDAQQLLDLVFTIGCYQTLSSLFRSLELEVDPDVPDLLRAQSAERDAPA
jgi:alkylhydroperoxidase family enzyme